MENRDACRLRSRRLRNLILIGMTASLLLPFVGLSWINYRASREWARAEISESALPLTRDTIYSEIHAELVQPIYVSTTMANDSFLKDWAMDGEKDPARVVRYLNEIHQKYGYFSVFYVSARTQRYFHYNGLHKQVSRGDEHDVWFFDFLARGPEYELDVDTDQAGNNALTIFLNFRVESADGTLLGVTGVGMKMDTVARLLSSTEAKYGRRIFLVNREGRVQAHTRREWIDRASLGEITGGAAVAGPVLSSLEEVSNLYYEGANGRVYLTARYIPELDWFLVVEEDESAALANARDNFVRTLAVGIAIWGALVVIVLGAAGRFQTQLESVARTDPLTGLANRRRFEEDVETARAHHARTGAPFVLMLFDLDGFKAVNDRLGHLAGDELLKAVARAMAATLRPTDQLARWGGDEFILLAFCPLEEANAVAERLRTAVAAAARELAGSRPDDPRRAVTACCGAVAYRGGASLDDLTHRADELLYRCKQNGGDRILVEAAPAPASSA
ncbi:MAG: sensor domain-containing diguanylate cyclase [Planctomycetota bacterium]